MANPTDNRFVISFLLPTFAHRAATQEKTLVNSPLFEGVIEILATESSEGEANPHIIRLAETCTHLYCKSLQAMTMKGKTAMYTELQPKSLENLKVSYLTFVSILFSRKPWQLHETEDLINCRTNIRRDLRRNWSYQLQTDFNKTLFPVFEWDPDAFPSPNYKEGDIYLLRCIKDDRQTYLNLKTEWPEETEKTVTAYLKGEISLSALAKLSN